MGIYGGAYLSFILEEGSKFIYVGFRELMLCHWNNGIYGRMVRNNLNIFDLKYCLPVAAISRLLFVLSEYTICMKLLAYESKISHNLLTVLYSVNRNFNNRSTRVIFAISNNI